MNVGVVNIVIAFFITLYIVHYFLHLDYFTSI